MILIVLNPTEILVFTPLHIMVIQISFGFYFDISVDTTSHNKNKKTAKKEAS